METAQQTALHRRKVRLQCRCVCMWSFYLKDKRQETCCGRSYKMSIKSSVSCCKLLYISTSAKQSGETNSGVSRAPRPQVFQVAEIRWLIRSSPLSQPCSTQVKHLTFCFVLHCAAIHWINTIMENLEKSLRKGLFYASGLIMRIFTIIYNILQRCYDERHNPESWSSLLTSPLAENNGGAGAFKVLRQSV